MSIFLKFVTTLLGFVSICHANSQLTVSYQPYGASEIVLKHRFYTMTGEDFAKYGLQAVKITVKNEGTQDAIFRPDREALSGDGASELVRYPEVTTVFKAHVVATAAALGILLGTVFLMDPWFATIREINKEIDGALEKVQGFNDKRHKLFEYMKTTGHPKVIDIIENKLHYLIAGLGLVFIVSFAESSYIVYTYGFNYVLFDFLHRELISDALVVAPGATVTKLMLVQKQSDSK